MKKIISILTVFMIMLGFVYLFPQQASAQSQSPTPSATGAVSNPVDEGKISFSSLGLTSTFLHGPYDTMYVRFSTPSEWQLGQGAVINLVINPSYTTATASSSTATTTPGEATQKQGQVTGGTLFITFNGKANFQVVLDWTGDRTLSFPLSPDDLKLDQEGGRYELRLFLDASIDCQFEHHTLVEVKPTSEFYLPHTEGEPVTNLASFSRPFYQRSSVVVKPAVLVIPENPSASEMQAALTVSAGFGRMTQGAMQLSLVPINQVSEDTLGSSNLIFVGKATGLLLLQKAVLPAPSDGSSFAAEGANPDDGIIQIAVSPWNKSNALLVVGGNSDSAVVKAAQAVSSGTLRIGKRSDMTLVADVLQSIDSTSVAEDRTIKDLGHDTTTLYGPGTDSTDITFLVPSGQVPKDGSYFQVMYNSSGLLDFTRSGMSIFLNGNPIGSARFSTLTNKIVSEQYTLPPDMVLSGYNTLTILVDLIPADYCSLYTLNNLWATIQSSSLIHMPLIPAPNRTAPLLNLGFYPFPFISNPTLNSMTFVLPSHDSIAWSIATQIAQDLGKRAFGSLINFGTVYGDNFPESVRKSQDLLIIGKATTLPIISEINNAMPAPFASGSDIATESSFRVVYHLPPDATIGYLELFSAPWDPQRAILTILGSNDEGLKMAGAAITISNLRSKLGGNFAVVNGNQVLYSDSRLMVGTGNISATVVPAVSGTEQAPNIKQTAVVPIGHPVWMPFAIVGVSLLIVITIIALGFFTIFRRKSP